MAHDTDTTDRVKLVCWEDCDLLFWEMSNETSAIVLTPMETLVGINVKQRCKCKFYTGPDVGDFCPCSYLSI